jgi:hypothetical protein
VVDLAGRMVARVPSREWYAAQWTQTWDGHGESGRLLNPGIYFVRMKFRGETISTRKVAFMG